MFKLFDFFSKQWIFEHFRSNYRSKDASSYFVIQLLILFQGKHIGRLGHQDPGEFPEEVKALFEKAVEYYEENMVSSANTQYTWSNV